MNVTPVHIAHRPILLIARFCLCGADMPVRPGRAAVCAHIRLSYLSCGMSISCSERFESDSGSNVARTRCLLRSYRIVSSPLETDAR